MEGSVALWLILFFLFVYFLPTIIASTRRHHNRNPIFLVNLFLGWTVLGWFVALVWSFTSPPVMVVRYERESP